MTCPLWSPLCILPIAGWTFHACCLGPHFDCLNPNIRCLTSFFLLINPFQLLVISYDFMRSPKFDAWYSQYCQSGCINRLYLTIFAGWYSQLLVIFVPGTVPGNPWRRHWIYGRALWMRMQMMKAPGMPRSRSPPMKHWDLAMKHWYFLFSNITVINLAKYWWLIIVLP